MSGGATPPAPEVEVAIIGAGPAGLMAAEVLACAGVPVHVFDAMPSVGRKFLLAGKGGLNLTHAEGFEAFASRYGPRRAVLEPLLRAFGADAVRDWARGLGVETFVGSSQRVFPKDFKAAPLLRAWLARLRHPAGGVPVQFHMRWRWRGDWAAGAQGGRQLGFDTPEGVQTVQARQVVLALGGASWPRLGSDGAWAAWLPAHGVPMAPLRSANCGFDAAGRDGQGWSAHLRERFAGAPLKSVVLRFAAPGGAVFERKGEFVLTAHGVEGSLIYAASALLRDAIEAQGQATLHLNLLPDWPPERVRAEVAHPRGARSLSSHLKSRLGLDGVKLALLHELLPKAVLADAAALAQAIQALPVTLTAPRPIEEAISSAGGVRFEALDAHLMLREHPGVFCAGEMVDWEAPNGGYLLTACLATGRAAGQGVLARRTAEGRDEG
ncbi:TIGR03862 family flavoprotein [Tibeticola sp.]|uniref:TIGR03862 family flavoprotein n=1 Tax=Tibeticola sp. TaxID=2005368 RepID=UPI0025E8F334|nr:TIGR03862 family flavoprotein [Tibeticola sp.]